jgi:hypothetical protein
MSVIRPLVQRAIPVSSRSRLHFALVGNRYISELYAAADPAMRLTRVSSKTQIVIDGYPRSGNGYCLAAMQYANPDVLIASHRHSPSSALAGLRHHLPVIVLIRPPRAAIASALQFEPDQDPAWGFELYRRYYEGILPVADRVLIATFDEVTEDFGEVTRRCNKRFNTDFVPYQRTEASERELSSKLDGYSIDRYGEQALGRVAARPSSTRQSADEYLSGLDQKLLDQFDQLDKLHDAVLLHK